MAEITKERKGQIQRSVLEVLRDNPDGIQARSVIKEVAERLTLTEYERSEYPNRPGVRRFDKILRFSTIGPVKAGWMTKEKGIWSITDAGEQVLREFPDPVSLHAESARLYREWKKQEQPSEAEGDETSDATTLEEAEENAWAEISKYLAQMNPYDFQKLVGGLLKGMGYHVSWISPPGPDKGIDILANTDPLGVDGPRIKVQVKRTPESKVTAEVMRAFMSTLGDNDVGLFVASGGFTRDAEKEAREQEKRRLTLLDLEAMFDLWKEHYDKIPEEERVLLPLRFVPYLAPDS